MARLSICLKKIFRGRPTIQLKYCLFTYVWYKTCERAKEEENKNIERYGDGALLLSPLDRALQSVRPLCKGIFLPSPLSCTRKVGRGSALAPSPFKFTSSAYPNLLTCCVQRCLFRCFVSVFDKVCCTFKC